MALNWKLLKCPQQQNGLNNNDKNKLLLSNINQSQKLNAEWEKPILKEDILYDSIYIKLHKQTHYGAPSQESVTFTGQWRGGGMSWLLGC